MTTLTAPPRRWLSPWTFIGLIFLLRLLYLPLFCSITDLAGDESYYWEWGRRPDWGYYSKPPMIGWLMGLAGFVTGHAEWGIRLAALVLGTLTLGCLALLADRMFGRRAAVLTVLLAALTPANAALNLFFTIDAPLMLCWSAALLAVWTCIEQPSRWQSWLFLGLALGFGNLSKQMMLVFPALLLVLLAVEPTLRPLLRRPGLWLAIVGSLAFLIPVVRWQMQHQWITLEHTREHFHAADLTVGKWFVQFLSFPVAQALLYTPVTWGLMILATVGGLWKWRSREMRQRFLVIFSGPALLVFCLLALRQSINPNWPAVFHLSALVLVAGSVAGLLGAGAGAGEAVVKNIRAWISERTMRLALRTGAVICALAYVLPLAASLPQKMGWDVPDPMRRLRGWDEAGAQAGRLLARAPRPERTFFLAMGHRENASQFAFYTPQHPRVYRWQPDGRIASQYELWPDASGRTGDDALILQPSEKPLPNSLIKAFSTLKPMGVIEVPLGSGENRYWQVFLGRELKRWPER